MSANGTYRIGLGISEVIARNLHDSSNYQPNWRFLTAERYLVEIGNAKDKADAIDELLIREKDAFVRELLLYQFGRRCVIASELTYALDCNRRRAQTRTAAIIEAMVVANRGAKEIAADLGTSTLCIVTFEKIFFNARQYLDHEIWLRGVCFPLIDETAPPHLQAEARLLATAFTRGWPGLASLIYRPHQARRTGNPDLTRALQILIGRATDYVSNLEFCGLLPSQEDLKLLLSLHHQELVPSATLHELDFGIPLTPEERRRREEAAKVVGSLSPLARKKLAALVEKCKSDAAAEEGREGGHNSLLS